MSKISIKGVGTTHEKNDFSFTPNGKRNRSCKSFRRRGIGLMTEKGDFEFTTLPTRQRGGGKQIKKTAHGGLSYTQDGAYFFYCKVFDNEGIDFAKAMRKELKEALS